MATPPSRYHSPSANHPASHPASAQSASSLRFPADDSGRSLAEMARRDLDAALQLLVDRAQYITGATGAAIALRRHGKNDMLCRASSGSNAPELGALLSTEYGLSGESVRTRQPLRCDDAERDVRVNRDVCRQLGIASVVVMPVVNDDGVLGVFELFSGNVNAFGERDLSAVQRLSELVETAVRLAEAAEKLPEHLQASPASAPAPAIDDEINVEESKAVAHLVIEEGKVAASKGNTVIDDKPCIDEDKVLEAQVLDDFSLGTLVSESQISEKLVADVLEVLKDDEPVLEGAEPVSEKVVPQEPKPAPVNAAASAISEKPQAEVSKSAEREAPSSVEARILDTKTEAAPAERKETEAKAAERSEAKSIETKAAEIKAEETKAVETKALETKSEAKPAAPFQAQLKDTVKDTSSISKPPISEPATSESPKAAAPEKAPVSQAASVPVSSLSPLRSSETPPPKKPLFWTAEVNPDAVKSEDADRSHVPPVLRNLRKCQACGFPVSADRLLCVECEEKRWRGQLKPAGPSRQPATSAPSSAVAAARLPNANANETQAAPPVPDSRARAVAAQAVSAPVPSPATPLTSTLATESKAFAVQTLPTPLSGNPAEPVESAVSTFVFGTGLAPSESWLSANKYVIAVLVIAGLVIAAFLWLH